MLTLIKEGKDPNIIVPILHRTGKRSRRPVATVYFTHNMKDGNKNTAPCKATLTLHRSHIKRTNQVSEKEFLEICEMIDKEQDIGNIKTKQNKIKIKLISIIFFITKSMIIQYCFFLKIK